jgi:hypothetical protein
VWSLPSSRRIDTDIVLAVLLVSEVMLHERSELCIDVVVARVVEVTFSKEDGFWAIELVGVVVTCAVENNHHAVDTPENVK